VYSCTHKFPAICEVSMLLPLPSLHDQESWVSETFSPVCSIKPLAQRAEAPGLLPLGNLWHLHEDQYVFVETLSKVCSKFPRIRSSPWLQISSLIRGPEIPCSQRGRSSAIHCCKMENEEIGVRIV
jgi:hypothetical protein